MRDMTPSFKGTCDWKVTGMVAATCWRFSCGLSDAWRCPHAFYYTSCETSLCFLCPVMFLLFALTCALSMCCHFSPLCMMHTGKEILFLAFHLRLMYENTYLETMEMFDALQQRSRTTNATVWKLRIHACEDSFYFWRTLFCSFYLRRSRQV